MRKNTLALSVNDEGNRVACSAASTPLANAEKADFWRLFRNDGYEREIPVHSAAQAGKVAPTASSVGIAYDGLVGKTGRRYDVRLLVHVLRGEEELELWAEIENRGAARGSEVQLPFVDLSSACHYSMCRRGEKIATGEGVLALWEGDWRSVSDLYGEWARSTFFKPAAYGLDVLLVFGWRKGRFDNGYPVYEPDPAQGGAEGLAAAISAIQAKGGRVALYTNGILMNRFIHDCRFVVDTVCELPSEVVMTEYASGGQHRPKSSREAPPGARFHHVEPRAAVGPEIHFTRLP